MAMATTAYAKDESWKLPLDKKAEIFEKNVLERHWIDGLYPSSVDVPLDGSPVDQTTQGSSNIAHSINWTSYYLGGQCYRYLFTKDEAVREHCNQIFEALYRCQLVTGVRGLQARGYAIGHGDSYEERGGSEHSNDWHQGAGKYSNYRWRGSPSHHNYSGAIYAFGMYYDLVAQGEWKDRCREAIDALVSYWADEEDFVIKKHDGSISAPILGFTDGKTPNTRIIMAAAGLKVAHHATGKQKFADVYEKLVTQYNFRTWRDEIQGSDSFDDTDHVLQHLENLFRIETDPQLRGFYRHVADTLWEAHKNDKQSLFNYIYYGLVPDAPGKEQALKDALWTLQSYPTNKIFRPRMNSIRKDIEIVNGRAKEPLPMYESPWDNEYQWKGNLYQLDGWLSRITVSLAIPTEDAMVMYATDGRYIFKTVDGGKNWRDIGENFPAQPKKLACGKRIRMLYVAASDGFYKTTTAGKRWQRLPLPSGSGSPVDIHLDRQNPNALYAITDQGVYRSIDYGEKWIGERWENLTENLPPANQQRFFVGLGEPTMVYAVLDDVVYSKTADAKEWQQGDEPIGISRYARTYPWIAIDPNTPTTLYAGIRSSYGSLPENALSISKDAGKTWSVSLRRIYERFKEGGMAALMEGRFRGGTIHDLVVDPRDSNIIYAAADDGVLKSTDGGIHWESANDGLEIPRAYTIFAPINSEKIYVGTPAGLFESSNSGEHWENSNLVLIFESNKRREVGSADYLDAYWRGRYFGFITDEQASAELTK